MTKKTLAESWLEGEIPLHMGLRFWAAIDDIAHFGVREARDAFQGCSEEYARLIWAILETIFDKWKLTYKAPAKALDKTSPEAMEDFLMQVYAGNTRHAASNYDLLSMLRRKGYEPLKEFEKRQSPEKVLAALVLHDCANDKGHQVHGAVYELTCRNWLNRGREGRDVPPDVQKEVSLIQEKLERYRGNLALGPKKAGEANKRHSDAVTTLFQALHLDMIKAKPAWGQEDHAKYIYEWAINNGVTVDGDVKKIPYGGTKYEVRTGGKRFYSESTIEKKIRGIKKGLK